MTALRGIVDAYTAETYDKMNSNFAESDLDLIKSELWANMMKYVYDPVSEYSYYCTIELPKHSLSKLARADLTGRLIRALRAWIEADGLLTASINSNNIMMDIRISWPKQHSHAEYVTVVRKQPSGYGCKLRTDRTGVSHYMTEVADTSIFTDAAPLCPTDLIIGCDDIKYPTHEQLTNAFRTKESVVLQVVRATEDSQDSRDNPLP